MSNSTDSEENDCLLCYSPLEPYDRSHPLQCPSRHCNFNCCMDCLEQMIKSTKDDQIEASDGNTFRIFLHCPNCRNSHLGVSIRDTLLLRKVAKYSPRNDGLGTKDEQLSASELRFKYALEKDEDIASAVDAARQREDDFFGRGIEVDVKSSFEYLNPYSTASWNGSIVNHGSIWSFDDEEGFEADLLGPHKSFIFRHHSMEDLDEEVVEAKELEDIKADPTLLAGLHAFMTDQEQQFMTAQLISGDTARLAAAAEMMHYVSALSLQGIKPNLKRRQSHLARNGSTKRSMLESVKEVIREGNEARKVQEERETRHAAGVLATQLSPVAERTTHGRRTLKNQVDRDMKKQMEYMKHHPLPLRMPKYAEVTASKTGSAGLAFWDDIWDGTVLDAYTKINVKKTLLGRITVTKQHAKCSGTRRVIDAKKSSPRSSGKGYIDIEKPRVIVAAINRGLGQKGVVRGDVVSHFNGELFTGTASDLTKLIDNSYEGELMTFVFNADSAVAEALKRRSMI